MAHHLITKNFNVFSASQFKEALTEPANTIIYLFYGNHRAWADDNNPPDTQNNLSYNYYTAYDNMIGGKQVTDNDVKHMVVRKDWTTGTVYDMYDDTTENLHTKQFFVNVNEGSDYNVFKCIDNNYGANSTASPSKVEVTANDEIYITSDGYQWKYMYTIPEATWDKFTTADYIPVIADSNVTSTAVDGAIHTIKVTDGGRDYSSYSNGYVLEYGVAGDNKLIAIAGTTGSIYQLSGNTAAFVKEEISTSYVESILISNGGAGFTTSDTIYISGGSPTTAAVANITSVDANGAITGLSITTRGKSYSSTPTAVANGAANTAAANLVVRLGSANGIIIDSNTTHITVSSLKGVIDTNDEITGQQSGTTSNIAAVTFTGDSLSSNTDFYKGSSFYVDSGTGAGQIAVIDEYIVTANQRRILLASELSTALASDSHFQISPQVIIQGDGTGAKARAVVNSTLNANTVANVQIVSTGSGYTWADITIRGNTGFVTNASSNSYLTDTAAARAIISPPGGHGANAFTELFASRIGISVTLANTESGKLLANNDYRVVGLLKDPLFANGTLTLSSSDTNFSANERVTGSTSNATAIVTAASSSEISMKDIRGFFQTGETITGNAAGNAVISSSAGSANQPYSVFRQTHKYTANLVYYGTAGLGLQEDELITQAESSSNGYLLSVLTSTAPDGSLEVTNQKNVFLLSDISGDKYIVGAQSAATAKLTGVSYPQVKDGSGEVIYIENVTPIIRDNDQSETFRLVLEF